MADTTKDIWNDNDGEESPKKSRKFRGIGVFLLTLVVVLGVLIWYAVCNSRANRDYFGM